MHYIKLNHEVFLFETAKMSAKPCIDCGHCKENFNCIFNDLENLYDIILKVDLIIIASPIYNLGFPAHLKVILDRMQVFYNKSKKYPMEKRKNAVLLLTCGKNDKNQAEILIPQTKCILLSLNAELKSTVIWENTDSNPKMSDNLINNVKNCCSLLE